MKKSEKLKALATKAQSLGLTPEEVAAFFSEISVRVKGAKTTKVIRPGMYYYSDRTISADIIKGKRLSGVVGWVDGTGRHGLVLGLRETEVLWVASLKWCTKYAFDGIQAGEAFLPSRDELVKIFKSFDAIQNALKKIDQPRLKEKDWYWSSSEYNYDYAWYVSPSKGDISYIDKKSNGHRVRCVLAF